MNNNKDYPPLVSVGIVTYNQIEFLRQCIQSVLSQDYPNFEIIVADDASTDLTQELLKNYAVQYPGKFVLRLSEKNKGITKNSNEAYFACSGRYIAFMGGDDLMLPGKLSAQVAWMEQDENRVICGHALSLCDHTGRVYGLYKKKGISGVGPGAWIKYGPLYGAPSIMIRKKNIPKYGFDERLRSVSDWKLEIDSLQKDSIYGYLDKVYGVYRRHDNNISNNTGAIANEAKLTLDLVEAERPELSKIINKGKTLFVQYGLGLHYMFSGQKIQAIRCFRASIKGSPFQWKSYVRLVQASFKQYKTTG